MPELSRAQLIVYAALAAVVLLLGARWIRASEEATEPGNLAIATGADAPPSDSFKTTQGDTVVHVAGEVAQPGVYRMPGSSRVTDAIQRAGGLTRDAAPDAINLAAPLADGQQVVIPPDSGAPGVASGPGDPTAAGPISLGTATVEDLDTIEGIGPVTAADIVEYRDSHGVGSVEDLDQISGIGPATMESLRASLQP